MRGVAIAVLVAMTALADAKPARWQTCPLPPAMPQAVSTGFIDVDGGKIYYATYGKPDGAPVVLLHGGMGNSDHWAFQVPALADTQKLNVIVIDSRGQGRSTRTKSAPSYDAMATDTLAVMDHLKVGKAAIVGWSDGGEVALKLGIHHADRVTRLFIFAANYDANGSKPRAGKPATTFNTYSAKCRADYTKLSKTPGQFNDLVQWLLPIWRNPMGFSKEQLTSIKAPTLVADGDHDEIIVLAQIEEMAKLIPNAQLRVFKDTSHFALWQDPASFNQVLIDFLLPAQAK